MTAVRVVDPYCGHSIPNQKMKSKYTFNRIFIFGKSIGTGSINTNASRSNSLFVNRLTFCRQMSNHIKPFLEEIPTKVSNKKVKVETIILDYTFVVYIGNARYDFQHVNDMVNCYRNSLISLIYKAHLQSYTKVDSQFKIKIIFKIISGLFTKRTLPPEEKPKLCNVMDQVNITASAITMLNKFHEQGKLKEKISEVQGILAGMLHKRYDFSQDTRSDDNAIIRSELNQRFTRINEELSKQNPSLNLVKIENSIIQTKITKARIKDTDDFIYKNREEFNTLLTTIKKDIPERVVNTKQNLSTKENINKTQTK